MGLQFGCRMVTLKRSLWRGSWCCSAVVLLRFWWDKCAHGLIVCHTGNVHVSNARRRYWYRWKHLSPFPWPVKNSVDKSTRISSILKNQKLERSPRSPWCYWTRCQISDDASCIMQLFPTADFNVTKALFLVFWQKGTLSNSSFVPHVRLEQQTTDNR